MSADLAGWVVVKICLIQNPLRRHEDRVELHVYYIYIMKWNGRVSRNSSSLNTGAHVYTDKLPMQCLLMIWRRSSLGIGSRDIYQRPYSRQVIDRIMVYNLVIHPPLSIYFKVDNGALRDRWSMKYNYQYDSFTIKFTVCDLVHWNYVTSETIPRVYKSWESVSICIFVIYIVLVIRHSSID